MLIHKQSRIQKAEFLANYEARARLMPTNELLARFDAMATILFTLTDEDKRDLAANALDILSNIIHSRKVQTLH